MDYTTLAKQFLKLKMSEPNHPHKGAVNDEIRGEHIVLSYLIEVQNGASPGELAAFGSVSTARIASILNNLEKKGFITRKADPKDRRKSIVNITEEGQKRGLEKKTLAINNISTMLEYLGEEDALSLIRIMQRMNDYQKGCVNSCD